MYPHFFVFFFFFSSYPFFIFSSPSSFLLLLLVLLPPLIILFLLVLLLLFLLLRLLLLLLLLPVGGVVQMWTHRYCHLRAIFTHFIFLCYIQDNTMLLLSQNCRVTGEGFWGKSYQQPASVHACYPAKIMFYKKQNLLYSDYCSESGWVVSAVCNHDLMSNQNSMKIVTEE